ncbi:MAG TPA: class I SAM-dependent methyltransferase [Phycisphaerae bacterium]|nr:class I SAM-dependent methyltransferase [Phycisphaerae bacterium]HRW53780.1 class I SAM-dependent methyltransferase [Phycisphaerae bacterium]
MWDERYSGDDYVYGTQPNDFLAQRHSALPKGRILSLAEGEGRNAVFLAKQGYDVTALDGSEVGLAKAVRLAEQNGVRIHTIHADLTDFDPGVAEWDGIVSIFAHIPEDARRRLYSRVATSLRQGGAFLLEAYTPAQIGRGTGGPQTPDLLPTCDKLRSELTGMTFTRLEELERDVIEGVFHTGRAAVVQAIAERR